MSCGTLSAGFTADACTPITPGLRTRLILLNYDDVASVTVTIGTMIATAITQVGATVGYAFTGIKLSNESDSELVVKKYAQMFTHSVTFRLFGFDGSVKKLENDLAKGKYIAVLDNNFAGTAGASRFEIFGAGTGLFAKVISRKSTDSDTGGAVTVTLETDPEALEGLPPYAFYITDEATTLAAVNALLV